MFRNLFSGMTPQLPLILAMAIFGAFFVAVVIRVSQRARKPEYDRMASLPLDHDSQPE